MAIKQQSPAIIEMQSSLFSPMRVVEIELGQAALPMITAKDELTGIQYSRALCLVRLHTYPVGIVELTLKQDKLAASEYLPLIWQAMGESINAHLLEDGLPVMTELSSAGLPYTALPQCLESRKQFLKQAPFVTVIVPTHDRADRLATCVASLVALQYPHYEIIVVDNAPSTSETEAIIRNKYADTHHVRYIREDRQGVSWARNCGMLAARGSILAYVDDDVVVDPYWLVEMVRPFSLFRDVACVSGLVLPLKLDTPAQIWFEEYGGFSRGFSRQLFDLAKHHPKSFVYPYHAGSFGAGGGSMAFTAQFLLNKGGFDTVLGGSGPMRSGEDMEVFFQVIKQGHTLVYEPRALAHHLHRPDYVSLCKQIRGYGMSLSGYLTKIVLDDPRILFDLLPRVPYGLFFMLRAKFSGRATSTTKSALRYPKELTRIELKGLLYGPIAYLQSRWKMRNAIA